MTSADIGIIDYIIVQERGGMDEFHEAAELMVFGAGIPAQSGTEEQQEGPDTLAAAIEDVCGDGIHEGDAGIQVLVDPISEPSSSA